MLPKAQFSGKLSTNQRRESIILLSGEGGQFLKQSYTVFQNCQPSPEGRKNGSLDADWSRAFTKILLFERAPHKWDGDKKNQMIRLHFKLRNFLFGFIFIHNIRL